MVNNIEFTDTSKSGKAPNFKTTRGFPRAIVCGMLRDSYKLYKPTVKIVDDKSYECLIELFKERQKKCWGKRYEAHQTMWDWYYKSELEYTQEQIANKFMDDNNTGNYPKHLTKNLTEAIGKWV